jgi:hypothetical protein
MALPDQRHDNQGRAGGGLTHCGMPEKLRSMSDDDVSSVPVEVRLLRVQQVTWRSAVLSNGCWGAQSEPAVLFRNTEAKPAEGSGLGPQMPIERILAVDDSPNWTLGRHASAWVAFLCVPSLASPPPSDSPRSDHGGGGGAS